MISSLTSEQEELRKKYHAQYLSYGLNTEPVNQKKVIKTITAMYKKINLAIPRFIFVPSPLAALHMINVLGKFNNINIPKGMKIPANIEEILVDLCNNKITGAPFNHKIEDNLFLVLEKETDRVINNTSAVSSNDIDRCFYGNLDAYWVCFYKFGSELISYSENDQEMLDYWDNLVKHSGLWYPYEKIVFVVDKPCEVHVEPTGNNNVYRLHNSKKAAMQYRDGYSVYSIHGVRVSEKVVLAPETLTKEDILNESNLEIRRIMIDQVGYEKFFSMIEYEVLDEDIEPTAGNPRRLLSINLPSDPDRRIVVVEVECSTTHHKYFLRVPPGMRTCLQAVAWTADMNPEEYVVLVET